MNIESISIEHLYLGVLIFGCLGGLAFIVTNAYPKYHTPWYRTGMGWNLMGMAGSISAIMGMRASAEWWGPYPAWTWLVLMLAVGFFLWQRTILLWKYRKQARDKEGGEKDAS